jgi:hypothetical protein
MQSLAKQLDLKREAVRQVEKQNQDLKDKLT